jgi:hypothetical protein
MYRVDPDAVTCRCALHRDRLGKQPDAAFGRAITGKIKRAAQTRERRHHDDRAAAGPAHGGKQCFTERNTPSRLIAVPAPVLQRHVDDRRHRYSDAGI